MSEDKRVIGCPVCHSTDTEDASVWDSNNVCGPGCANWKIFDTMVCNSCGVYFKDVSKHE